MSEPRQEQEFLYLNTGNFEVVKLKGLATRNPTMWFIPGEGTCTIGLQIFTNMEDLKIAARQLLHQHEHRLDTLRKLC